jgi:hypothetical protein
MRTSLFLFQTKMETDQVRVKTEEEEKADDVASFPSAETSCRKHIKTER